MSFADHRKRTGGSSLVEEASKKERWRMRFLHSIHQTGLETEEEVIFQGKRASVFIKVHATWPVLSHYAEELNLRAPLMVKVISETSHETFTMAFCFTMQLKTEQSDLRNGSEMLLEYLGLPNPMKLIMPNKLSHFYTCPFRAHKISR